MATQQLAVEILFNAVNNVGQGIGTLKGDFDGLASSIESVADPFASFTKGLLATETAVAALGVALVGVAVEKAGKFRDSVNEIGTLFGGTNEQVDQFSGAILEYGQKSTQSLESINGAIYAAISAGTSYENSIALVNETEKLSVAGRADLTETTKVLVGALNSYGESTQSAAQFSDILFSTVKNGQTTLPELSASLGQITAIASTAGVPFGDLGAAIATLTSSGIGTSEAVSGLKAALSNIISPSTEAAKAAEALGVQFDINAVKSKGLDGVLQDLMKATNGNVSEMASFFGSVEGLNAVMALGKDGAAKFAENLTKMEGSAGATNEAFKSMSENFTLVMQQLNNASDVALITFGDNFKGAFGSIAQGFTDLLNGFTTAFNSDNSFSQMTDQFAAWGEQLGQQLSQIAKNLPEAFANLDFSDLMKAFSGLGDEIGDLFGKMFGEVDLSTPEGLSEAMQKVVDVITSLVNITSGVAEEFSPIFEALGQLGNQADETSVETEKLIGNFLGAMTAISDLGLAIGGLVVLFQEGGGGAAEMAAVFDALKGVFNSVQVAFDGIMIGIGEGLKLLVQQFDNLTFGAFGDKTSEILKNIDGVITDFKDSAVRNAGEAGDAFGKISEDLEGFSSSDANEQMKASAAALENFGKSAEDVATTTKEFTPIELGDFDPVAVAMERMGIAAQGTAEATNQVAEASKQVAPDWATAEDKARGYKVIMDEMGNVSYVQVGKAAGEASKATQDHAKAMEDAAKKAEKAQEAANKWALEMEKIASNERIKLIEASVKLNIAELEAQTEQVKAAFASIDNTVNSTGELISNLFGALDKADSFGEKWMIEDMIKREEARRQKALDLQTKLVEAQIKYLDARASAIGKGDAIINVKADGLEAHLEKIWFEIMKKIQLKASEEGLEMLIGALA